MNPRDSTTPHLPIALRNNREIGQNRIVKNEPAMICAETRHAIHGSCEYEIVSFMKYS